MVRRSVRWEDRALDDLRRLGRRDPPTARRIGDAVARYAETGYGDVKKLEGGEGEWRLRVGAWRVIFAFDPPGFITILAVVHRRDAYRD